MLIERVRELLRRGVAPDRILATTFNRAARAELQHRLTAAGVRAVQARTFHSLGRMLLREAGLGRPGEPGSASPNQWKRFCALAARDTGTWVEVADARARVSDIKLALLATPDEFARRHTRAYPDGEALARIYAHYERAQAERGVNDFDDMVMLAVRALREHDQLRTRWQARFTHVLVDEYQDIEPAQEQLVRILAAPQDELFCVGDDDQTLYGFRRASVRRTLDLDLAYPGLERIALAHNYRCPPEIVTASRRLIAHNRVRFPKPIEPDPERPPGRPIALHEYETAEDGATRVVSRLARSRRGEIVVLARTTHLLRTVALACAARGIRIAAPARVFEAGDAHAAIEAYVRLCAAPLEARADDVALVFRRPNRGLPFEGAASVAEQLRAGRTFAESVADLAADDRGRAKLDAGGRLLDRLAAITDARRFIGVLRTTGGLDEHFAEHDSGGTEQIELEVLEQAEREATGMSLAAYRTLLAERAEALDAIRDDEHGIELATIHGAKGRQWPRVELFGGEEGQLPHARALEVTAAERAAGEGEEAERRLAYVAFTRASERLTITVARAAASRFLTEAGLEPQRPYAAPQPRREPPPPSRPAKAAAPKPLHDDPGIDQGLREASRSGLAGALRQPDRRTAVELAAVAIERELADETLTVGELCDALRTHAAGSAPDHARRATRRRRPPPARQAPAVAELRRLPYGPPRADGRQWCLERCLRSNAAATFSAGTPSCWASAVMNASCAALNWAFCSVRAASSAAVTLAASTPRAFANAAIHSSLVSASAAFAACAAVLTCSVVTPRFLASRSLKDAGLAAAFCCSATVFSADFSCALVTPSSRAMRARPRSWPRLPCQP